jgi:hypothetical protein
MRIPSLQTKKWRVSYLGQFFGDVIRTFNLDLFSDKGRIKTGGKIYPHTTAIEPITAFTKAKIEDTTRKTKLWGVSSKVYASESDGEFQEITDTGFSVNEEANTNSDILSVVEDENLLEIEAEGNVETIEFGGNEKISQSILGPQLFDVVYLRIKNIGTDKTYNLKLTVQGSDTQTITLDSPNEGVFYEREQPDGTPQYTAGLVAGSTIDDDGYELVKFSFSERIEITGDNKKCLVLETNEALSANQEIEVQTSSEDTYTNGELTFYDSSWDKHITKMVSSTAGPLTDTPTGALEKVFEYEFTTSDGEPVKGNIVFKFTYSATVAGSSDYAVLRILKEDGTFISSSHFTSNNSQTGSRSEWKDTNAVATHTITILPTAEIEDGEKLSIWVSSFNESPSEARQTTITRVATFPYVSWDDLSLSRDAYLKIGTDETERVYITTNRDVLSLEDEADEWQSLWKGTLEREDLNSDYPAILKNLGAGGTLILGNDNLIHTFSATATSPTEGTFNKLIFDPNYFINWIRVTSSSVFIGLQNKLGELEPSQVVHYEPYTERTRIFTINEGATMGFIKDENCHIIDKLGQIRQFTGASFQPYLYFPCYYRDETLTTLPHRNGIIERGQIVKIAWEGQYPDPAGVWVIEDNNLYHKHSLVFDKDTINSLGALEVESLGAIYEDDNLFIGGNLKDGTSTDVKGVFSTIKTAVATDNRANFTTAKLISQEIIDIWQDIVLKYDPATGGTIKVKYKVEPNKVGITDEYTGTWTSSTTFTSTTAGFITAVNNGNIAVGDEVIIRTGQGGGLLAHITQITGTTTKTITIDEGLDDISSGTFTFSVEKWKLINFDINNNKFSSEASLKDEKLESTQLKVEINKHTLEEIQVSNVPNYSIKKI